MNLHYQNFVSFLKKYCYDHIEDIDGYDSNGHINLYFNRMIPLNLRISTELRPKFIDRFISKLEIFLSNDDICNDNKDITIIFGKERHKKIIFDYFLIQNYPLKEFKTLGGILFANIVQSEVINYLFEAKIDKAYIKLLLSTPSSYFDKNIRSNTNIGIGEEFNILLSQIKKLKLSNEELSEILHVICESKKETLQENKRWYDYPIQDVLLSFLLNTLPQDYIIEYKPYLTSVEHLLKEKELKCLYFLSDKYSTVIELEKSSLINRFRYFLLPEIMIAAFEHVADCLNKHKLLLNLNGISSESTYHIQRFFLISDKPDVQDTQKIKNIIISLCEHYHNLIAENAAFTQEELNKSLSFVLMDSYIDNKKDVSNKSKL